MQHLRQASTLAHSYRYASAIPQPSHWWVCNFAMALELWLKKRERLLTQEVRRNHRALSPGNASTNAAIPTQVIPSLFLPRAIRIPHHHHSVARLEGWALSWAIALRSYRSKEKKRVDI